MRWLAAVLAVFACSGPPPEDTRAGKAPAVADPDVPRFPVPPRQQDPWPGDARLPAALIDAARTLFAQGFADPRGCAYREIELVVGSVSSSDGETVKTHGFVLPGYAYAIAWNGLVYPVTKIGAKVDLAADLVGLLAGPPAGRPSRRSGEVGTVELGVNLEAVVLLARLGASGFAERVWRATQPEPGPIDWLAMPDEPDPYGLLSEAWAWRIFDRAVTAHMRGAHPLALESLRLLGRVQPQIEAAVVASGLAGREPGHPHLDFLASVPALLADEERRAARGTHAPLADCGALATLPAAVQVAVLIDQLDEVAVPQISQPGGVNLSSDPIVEALIQIGEPAVEPLIEVVAWDTRLTRSVHFWRDFAHQRSLLGVHEAAYAALAAILDVSVFSPVSTGDDLSGRGAAGRAEVTSQLRAYWARSKAVPSEERWYRELADDRAGPEAWLDAADKITRDRSVTVRWSRGLFRSRGTGTGDAPRVPRGAALRMHAAPSVTALIGRRIASLEVDQASALALMLFDWDRAAGAAALDQQLQRAIQASGTERIHARAILNIIERRLDAGDLGVLEPYAAWLEEVPPSRGAEFSTGRLFAPLARAPLRPSIVTTAERMFRAGSPWLPRDPVANLRRVMTELLGGNLVVVPAFTRRAVEALADRRTVARLEMDEEAHYSVAMTDGGGMSSSVFGTPSHVPPPHTTRVVRMADWCAWTLASHHDAAPRFELFWSDAERAAALPAMVAWVKDQVAKP